MARAQGSVERKMGTEAVVRGPEWVRCHLSVQAPGFGAQALPSWLVQR